MNRMERRAQRGERLNNVVDCPAGFGIKTGDNFTVKRVRRNADGSLTHKCEPGTETIFIANVIK